MKKFIVFFIGLGIFTACDSGSSNTQNESDSVSQQSKISEDKISKGSVNGLDVKVVDIKAINYIGMSADVRRNDIQFLGNTVKDLYGKLITNAEGEFAPDSANLLSIYQSFGADQLNLIIAIQLPDTATAESVKLNNSSFGSTNGGRAVKARHEGSYSNLLDTHDKIRKYLQQENLQMMGNPYEIYRIGPSQQSDTTAWLTEIYYPISNN